MAKEGFNTSNLHSDRKDNPEHGVLHKAIHPSVAYGYEDARHLAEVFQGKRAGYNYGRQLNPTVTALQNRLTTMEDGVASIGFAIPFLDLWEGKAIWRGVVFSLLMLLGKVSALFHKILS